MKKIERRAIMCLMLALVLVIGVGVFCYRFVTQGDDWASYEGNRDVYAEGDLSKGAIYDINGQLLLQNTYDGPIYNESQTIRKALMHITGDPGNNISTGANRAFTDELIGYDLLNGVYTLNNAGEEITLTLDADICAAAYNALAGRNGTVGVYNYKTGEVICMVSTPTYDPENPPSDPEEGVYINRFTSATFVPGSVFKLLTAAAAIETLDDAYTWEINCAGYVDYGHGDKVTDLATHGRVNLGKALEVSCNCYFGQLSEKLGGNTIEKYVHKTLLDKSIDINGIKTTPGTFDYPEGGVNLAWTGIGQYHDMVNPCSMMVFMGGIANDGKAVMPSIVSPKTIVGKKFSEFSKSELKMSSETIIDSATASSLTDMMANNVKETYGSDMFPGLNVCAKSGTAEVGGGKKPNAWFVGFLDDEENPYAFVVMVQNGGYGASTSGSIANKVLQEIVN